MTCDWYGITGLLSEKTKVAGSNPAGFLLRQVAVTFFIFMTDKQVGVVNKVPVFLDEKSNKFYYIDSLSNEKKRFSSFSSISRKIEGETSFYVEEYKNALVLHYTHEIFTLTGAFKRNRYTSYEWVEATNSAGRKSWLYAGDISSVSKEETEDLLKMKEELKALELRRADLLAELNKNGKKFLFPKNKRSFLSKRERDLGAAWKSSSTFF